MGKRREGGGGVQLVPGLGVRAGQTIAGKYRVDELLGSGPSGVVLAARNVHLREPVTLKVIASYADGDEALLERRLAKARLASRLHSVHVARILDIGTTEEGMPYIATEQLEGNTLEVELAERGPLGVEEAVRWVLEACEGLAEAHARGLVHGDLKPKNIFLAKPKAADRRRAPRRLANETLPMAGAPLQDTRIVKILDFGSTSPLDAIGDEGGTAFFGSPAFVAPEQVQDAAAVDSRADVWALGVLLYHLVSGSLPFTADTVSGVIIAVVYDAPTLLTEAPYELARLVHRCLDKDPAKRPQDVRELAEALAPFAGGRGGRLSERVGAMLDAPPVSAPSPLVDHAALAPVAVSIAPRRRASRAKAVAAFEDDTTSPSLIALARRRRFQTRALLGSLAVAASVALAVFAAPALRAAPALVSNALAPSGPAAGGEASSTAIAEPASTVEVPAFVPSIEDSTSTTTVTAADLPAPADAPVVSFAALRPEDVIPTPLALPAAPPVASAAQPAERPPTLLPPPVTATTLPASRAASAPPSRATTPFKLPAGLPTTRDALSPSVPSAPRSAHRAGGGASTASATSTHAADDSYVRRLFGERDQGALKAH